MDVAAPFSFTVLGEAVMQLSTVSANASAAASQIKSTSTATPTSEITSRSQMSGNPDVDYTRGFPPTLLLTKDDISLIKKVTGVNIDYETGKADPLVTSDANNSFIGSIIDKRETEFESHQTSSPLTEAGLRDAFKKAASENKPVDTSLISKAFDIVFDKNGDSKSDSGSTRKSLDIYV